MAHVNFTHRFGDKCTLILGDGDDVFLSVGEDPENRQISILYLKAMRRDSKT
ncbi:hypothetical protein H4683_001859 [Filibacter limicola]|uniref:Uncharacterized protein n=1 Tax=Sporosarcina limicola TaxID=34101 RepID=A0A927MJ38_9BACL|nr:hypothetical protein [Sporosarcina limicola]